DAVSNEYWDRLYTDHSEFQFALLDGDEVLAQGNSVPVPGQPAHWRDAFLAAFERGGEPDRLCAIAIMVSPEHRGRGLSTAMLQHMRGRAVAFGSLVAPVRPTLKERYPLIPIETYAGCGATTARTSTRGSAPTSTSAARSPALPTRRC